MCEGGVVVKAGSILEVAINTLGDLADGYLRRAEKAEAERDMLREWIEGNNPAMDVDVFLSAPGEGERTVRDE